MTTYLMTIDEVAEEVRVSRWSVQRAIHAGKLPAVMLGPRSIRVRPGDLEVWVEGARVNG